MPENTTRTASGNPDRPYDGEDISSRAFWSTTADEREKTFARLRERGTVTWHPPFEDSLLDDPDDHGFWAVTTYDDLVEVTKRHEDFLSGPGILMESAPAELVEAAQSIIAMDPPRHSKMRKLVSAAFTPKQMRRINDRIEANARKVVDNLVEQAEAGGGTAEFVAECAELLPMHNINDMMGVPDGDRQAANHEMKVLVGWNDPELVGHTQEERVGRMFQAIMSTHELCRRLADERRQDPQDDLITALVQAEVDGEQLSDADVAAFFCLLTIAGTDTTRQSTSHGLRALTTHPDQREWLLADLEGRVQTAVEEIVRWATPIMTFRRTAAHDVEFRGQQITEGDKVVMFYSSANRDENRIERPHELDLSRHPNPHISFGGGGIHHCLGNQLARFQLRALFTELLTRVPEITAGEPELMPSNFFHAVKRMPAHL
jgi:cytochrome P450